VPPLIWDGNASRLLKLTRSRPTTGSLQYVDGTTLSFAILTGATILVVAWLLVEPLRVALRRNRVRRQPYPSEWREILRERVPYFRLLPADLQLQLKKHVQVFIAEKSFVGCDGLIITDEMRVTIAAQACLLILNRRGDYYPALHQILVYPGPFVVDREQTDRIGLVRSHTRVLSGESWAHGQVILSWPDVLEGAAVVDDGSNVVIHEFAHQLDQEKGFANGAPFLGRREAYRRWSGVLGREFAALHERLKNQQASLFSPYAATDPAEFFAVISEVFFEQPRQMAAEYPDLYNELGRFYRVDPLAW
jgi:MtfA peptidase